jgi:hypothetical protein
MAILLPRFRHIKPPKPLRFNLGLSGEIRAILYDLNMNVRQDTDWGPNLIVDNGMNSIPKNRNMASMSIGAGTATPTVNDTKMQIPLASVGNVFGAGDAVNTAAVTPDYEYARTRSRRFGAGIGTGTVTEAGAGYNTNGLDIFNRALLPAPVEKGIDNVLDVIFRLWIWPDLTDHDSTAEFKGITYDTITRASNVGDYTGGTAWESFKFLDSGTNWQAFDGAIGLVTEIPAGNNAPGGGTWTNPTYIEGSFEQEIHYYVGLNQWVLGSGIRCLIGNLNLMQLQTQFTEATGQPNPGDPVPKDATEIMDFSWMYRWARRP